MVGLAVATAMPMTVATMGMEATDMAAATHLAMKDMGHMDSTGKF